eukprot:11083593-Lingulodinium_polyedra.AAC.1
MEPMHAGPRAGGRTVQDRKAEDVVPPCVARSPQPADASCGMRGRSSQAGREVRGSQGMATVLASFFSPLSPPAGAGVAPTPRAS